ncbi:hypothetical protein CUMW_060450 [Citrus unshiu]|uniref:Uncharacterized protein n=1 Tax=Citrus unshiu TaxID=55188 RepID=A0A2H5NNQ4_CITUN|nr:hypothetical protein CUMW_060450 [Citrus unshiu]
MQSILATIGKLRGCIRQIENQNPRGASEQEILNRAKVLLAQDKKYNKWFKFDHKSQASQNTSNNIGQYFDDIGGSNNDLPYY